MGQKSNKLLSLKISLQDRMKRNRFFSIYILFFFSLCIKGQTLDDAKSWYQEGRYTEALPVFQAEYLNNANNPSVNQWLGVSLFKTGKISRICFRAESAGCLSLSGRTLYTTLSF